MDDVEFASLREADEAMGWPKNTTATRASKKNGELNIYGHTVTVGPPNVFRPTPIIAEAIEKKPRAQERRIAGTPLICAPCVHRLGVYKGGGW